MKIKFNDTEKQQIEEAVKALEKETSGELVMYYSRQSDEYDEANWITSIILSFFGIIVIMISSYLWLLPSGISLFEIGGYLIVLMALGFFIPKIWPKIKRFVISDEKKELRVFSKASDAFLSEEVFQTKDRTGILIYISELEQQVVVIADSGINAKVNQSDWNDVVSIITNGIKTKQLTSGIIEAINQCKNLLLDNDFKASSNDTNELSDELRID